VDQEGLSLLDEIDPVDVSMTFHFIEMGTENKARPPEVVVWFPISADMDTPESVSPAPANQFVQRIRKDLAHGGTLFQSQSRIVSWNGLRKKVDHRTDSHTICVDRVVLQHETNNTPFYHARVEVPCQPSSLPFLFFCYLKPILTQVHAQITFQSPKGLDDTIWSRYIKENPDLERIEWKCLKTFPWNLTPEKSKKTSVSMARRRFMP